VSNDVHVVLLAELDEGVGRGEIIPVRAFPRLNERPLQIVLIDDLVELSLDQVDVPHHLFQGPVDVVGLDRRARRDGAVDGRANQEMALEGFLQGVGRLG
jgi:hypothetical protein